MDGGEGVLNAGDREALETWALGPIHGAATPTSGAVNRTVLLQTARGRYVLRGYRHFESYYLDGNDRVRQWIRQGSFIPFWDRWAEVAPALR
jgi:hypothetical protein